MSFMKNKYTRIAVFGGSFDPFHQGHQKIIDEALNDLDIEKLFLVPTYLNPFKQSYTDSPQNRLITLQNKKFDSKVEILDYEILQNRATPTIETINFISHQYEPKKIYLIIGADNLASLNKWKNYDQLKEKVEFVVASRDDIVIPNNYKTLNVKESISSTQLRSKEALSPEPK